MTGGDFASPSLIHGSAYVHSSAQANGTGNPSFPNVPAVGYMNRGPQQGAVGEYNGINGMPNVTNTASTLENTSAGAYGVGMTTLRQAPHRSPGQNSNTGNVALSAPQAVAIAPAFTPAALSLAMPSTHTTMLPAGVVPQQYPSTAVGNPLQGNSQAFPTDESYHVGIELKRREDRVIVSSVTPGSSAMESGKVKKGNSLIAVGDKRIRGMSLQQIRKALQGPQGSEVQLVFSKRIFSSRSITLRRMTACQTGQMPQQQNVTQGLPSQQAVQAPNQLALGTLSPLAGNAVSQQPVAFAGQQNLAQTAPQQQMVPAVSMSAPAAPYVQHANSNFHVSHVVN